MDNITVINDYYSKSYKTLIRSTDSTPEEIRKAIELLGAEIGKVIFGKYFTILKQIKTPMGFSIDSLFPSQKRVAIITTKDDFEYLGKGMKTVFENTISGYINFEGIRGAQALNSHIRDMMLPDQGNEPISTLIIGKAVLATGCTAITLTKTAFKKYMPRNLVIASIFYSKQGLQDIISELPNADMVLIGEPDNINSEGMLEPGIGNLDQRINECKKA